MTNDPRDRWGKVRLGLAALALAIGCTTGGADAPADPQTAVVEQQAAEPTEVAQEETPDWIAQRGQAGTEHRAMGGRLLVRPDDEQPVPAAEPVAAPPTVDAPVTAGTLASLGAREGGGGSGARVPEARPTRRGDGLAASAGGRDFGHGGLGTAPIAISPPRAHVTAPTTPLPQSGVLASTFVGGGGAQARLEDLLDRGVLVGGRQVRLEAFDDLGRLPYAVPSEDAVALYANLERDRLVTGGERVHLQIALMARQGEMPARPRMDIRLVVDRSGSMYGEKWTNAIAAAHALVERLAPNDTFGLISYSDGATVDLPPQRVGNRRRAHTAIDGLLMGGGTNIDAALELAEANAPSRRHPNDVLMVMLLSDGVANVGQTNADEIASRARSMFDSAGVLTTTIGVGTDFDETTMLSIAREGSGSYHFVRRAEDISRILTDELEERAQAVAQDLRLRIELAPGVVATRVYGSRMLAEQEAAAVRATEVAVDARLAHELGITRDRQEDDQRGLRMHFPTFRRGDQHIVLMELEVPPGTDLTQVARVSLDWKDLVRGVNDHSAVDVAAERTTDAEAALASTSRPVKRTVLAFQAGEALQDAAESLEHGDHESARIALAERIELLRTASTLWHDRALDHDVRILEQYQEVLAGAWPAWGDDSRHTLVLAMNYFGDRRMQ